MSNRVDKIESQASMAIRANETARSITAGLIYHELSDRPVSVLDAGAQIAVLHRNLAALQDLQARVRFLNREIRYLLKA